MAEHDQDTVDVAELEGWDGAHAPAGFAERVTGVWIDERRGIATSRPRGRRAAAIASAVIGLAVLLGIAFAWRATAGHATTGSLSAYARASASIGERAEVVAESGAELRWDVARDGGARVEQSRGVAFYRVEHGAPFEVSTPHGSVRVTGTCFRVEVEEMGRSGYFKAGAAGAVLAAAVVVTVYEGGVVLARDGHEVALAPGDRGRADERGARRTSSDHAEGERATASEPSIDAGSV
ncbi:MAG: FecR domain-containing protein, partial [Deltaproteobacteria bacterium]|nr:FecR domain-containing protein [Nannocystaceae bacterium]